MGIISKFVREQKRYTKNELMNIFVLSYDDAENFIKNLKAFGVLKSVKNYTYQKELSDLLDEDIDIVDISSENEECFYVFTYVGVITIGHRIIKCYPKYLKSNDEPINEMKQVLKVLEKYGAKEQIVNMFNGEENRSSFNILTVIIFLLNDYHENGIYDNTEDIIESNGLGEILWDKTINEGFSIVSNNRPYHIELYTKKTINNEFDFFKCLHECILTECSNHLEASDLLELFDMTKVSISEETLDSFGDTDYILYRLQSELSVQFNTRKQILLKTLYAYVSQNGTLEDTYGINMYGTNNFNLVWEDVCSEVLNNQLNSMLGQLKLPVPLKKEYMSNYRLIDIIEKPIWSGKTAEGIGFSKASKDTLIPDIVTIAYAEDKAQFIILDAKYYNIQLEKDRELRGTPGIGDITKQYLYQLAYDKFMKDHQIKTVKNYFLMPTEDIVIINKGIVNLEMMCKLGLTDINIRLLPAKKMFEYYLVNNKIDVSVLNLD